VLPAPGERDTTESLIPADSVIEDNFSPHSGQNLELFGISFLHFGQFMITLSLIPI
jgi:hypothetical protein|tara:strand:- start:256 stop:423 length:168 start_codon:yes stop_codon:yes gene_type:complete